MDSFVRGLITEWRRLELPVAEAAVVVAVSGGADSVSLLLALVDLQKRGKLDLRLVAAHFNHGLRGQESEADEAFVKALTTEHGTELAIGREVLSREGNLEQNARVARYEFLQRTAENVGALVVLTAHTINDQAETFLLNLVRGSGPDGLGAMRPVRPLEGEKVRNGEGEERRGGEDRAELSSDTGPSPLLPFSPSPLLLVRPLLRWAKRADTERFCLENGVDYRLDSMNDDLAFKRVRIRKILLPMLEEFNPKIVETLANTAGLLQDLTERSSVEADEAKVSGSYGQIEAASELILSELAELPKPELYQRLREWLTGKRGNKRGLALKHIEAIERLVFSRKSGKTVELPGGGAVVKSNGRLEFRNLKVEKSGAEN
jgi:tRNA(Ile)-lysidine synthase